MEATAITCADVPGGHTYVPAVQLTSPGRLLFVSGQIPETADGHLPPDFAGQCRLTWQNLITVLGGAGMGPENLVKVTTYLSDRRYREENAAVRDEVLGEHRVALTVVIAGIFDPKWLLEIEAVAAA